MKGIKGRIASIACCLVVAPCLLYYSSKFYISGSIVFDNTNVFMWCILVGFSLLSLVRLWSLEENVKELKTIILEMRDIQILNHHNNIDFQKGTRKFIMEVNKVKEDITHEED